MLEQPGGSSLEYYPTFRHFLTVLFEVSGLASVFISVELSI